MQNSAPPSPTPPEEGYRPTERNFSEFAALREKLWAQKSSGMQQADNLILTISSALLILSVTFMKDIVGNKVPVFLELLIFSWFALALSILCVFVSHHATHYGCEFEEQRAHDYHFLGNKDCLKLQNKWTNYTRVLNAMAAVCFLLGVICTLILLV